MRRVLLVLLRAYQAWNARYGQPCCRFHPSCSTYAVEAIERFGVVRGCSLIIARVLRCQPLCTGGYDPVPSTFSFLKGSCR